MSWDGPDADPSTTPTLHLPHLLRILGPAAFTVYKHVLGRKRVLIYTRPPVEAACTLCHVAADLAFMDQVAVRGAFFSSDEDADADGEGVDTLVGGSVVGAEWERQSVPTKLKGRCGEGVKVLGMVTLIDLDKMQRESASGTGWVACTTDAIFLEKPQHYDLLIDLTTASPGRPSRPTLHVSRPLKRRPGSRGPTHALHTTHTAWSDVKAWTELDRILRLDGDHHARCCEPPAPAVHRTRGGAAAAAAAAAAWPDVWRLYEDVCVLCAGLWLGGWRRSSGLGYEGCASASGTVRGTGTAGKGKGKARAGVRTVFTEVADGAAELDAFGAADAYADDDDDDALDEDEEGAQDRERRNQERRERQVLTTLALLQTFHAHTCFLLARLAAFLPPPPPASPSAGSDAAGRHADIAVTPHDLVDFDLGPLSTLDAQFVVWLAAEYGGAAGARVAVRRGWREVVRLCLGLR